MGRCSWREGGGRCIGTGFRRPVGYRSAVVPRDYRTGDDPTHPIELDLQRHERAVGETYAQRP
jgi:hypothetical protein